MLDAVLGERQSAFEQKAQRVLRAVEKVRAQILAKTKSQRNTNMHSGSYIDRLPLELIISIFGHTNLSDVVRLRTVCRAFKDLIDMHEHVIVTTMLNLRLGSNIQILSKIFPPPKPRRFSEEKFNQPTLQYLQSLKQRHEICNQLAYFLALITVAPKFDKQLADLGRKERERRKNIAIEDIRRFLTRQLFYVDRFLTTSRLHLSADLASHAVENSAHLTPAPIHLSRLYNEVQTAIIGDWPDAVLLSTHHAFHFLVNSIRVAFDPQPPHDKGNDLVSLMLRCPSPLQRCNEFFAADLPTASRRQHAQFMMDMEQEKEKIAFISNIIFGDDRKGNGRRRGSLLSGCSAVWDPKLRETWFDAAKKELSRRGLTKHTAEKVFTFPGVAGEVMIGCPDCELW